MKVRANTLYVSTEGAYLHKENETLVMKLEGKTKAQIPLLHLRGIVCLNRVMVSPELMATCAKQQIHIAFFSIYGKFLARVEGMPGGNVLLRRQQYRVADDPVKSAAIARSFIVGKVVNTRHFLLHARRDAQSQRKQKLADIAKHLEIPLRSLAKADLPLDSIRGLEGIAAKEYFSVFPLLLKQNSFTFTGRNRYPPRDPVNALLSFGYVLLMQDCAGAAAGVGLDPAVGFLHQERPGRLSLALDLMEELRVPVVDRLVLSLINRRQIKPNDFHNEASGGWRLKDEPRKTFLVAYQEAKQVEVRHEFLEQSLPWGQIPHMQALLLARLIRGDLDVYPPFSIR